MYTLMMIGIKIIWRKWISFFSWSIHNGMMKMMMTADDSNCHSNFNRNFFFVKNKFFLSILNPCVWVCVTFHFHSIIFFFIIIILYKYNNDVSDILCVCVCVLFWLNFFFIWEISYRIFLFIFIDCLPVSVCLLIQDFFLKWKCLKFLWCGNYYQDRQKNH